jgi:hypothetical protein
MTAARACGDMDPARADLRVVGQGEEPADPQEGSHRRDEEGLEQAGRFGIARE